MNAKYKPIFVDEDWVFEKYYGWIPQYRDPNLVVLLKRYGPVRRYLVMSSDSGYDVVGERLANLGIRRHFDEIFLRDFSNGGTPHEPIAGIRFHHAGSSRLLNDATFVLDLRMEARALWARMKTDYRRECNKMRECGIQIEFFETPQSPIDLFFARHETLVKRHSIDRLDEILVRKMLGRRDVFLAVAKSNDTILSMALVYCTRDKAYFLHGVGSETRNDLSGRLLHWEIAMRLKKRRLSWYDLGGVPEINDTNGIYTFKKRFGGELVRFGAEYFYRSRQIEFFRKVVRSARGIWTTAA